MLSAVVCIDCMNELLWSQASLSLPARLTFTASMPLGRPALPLDRWGQSGGHIVCEHRVVKLSRLFVLLRPLLAACRNSREPKPGSLAATLE